MGSLGEEGGGGDNSNAIIQMCSLNNDYIGCTLKIWQLINKPYMYPAHKIIAA